MSFFDQEESKNNSKNESIVQEVVENASDNMSISQLELLANKKKLVKSDELTINSIIKNDNASEKKSRKSSSKKNLNSLSYESHNDINSEIVRKQKQKLASKENCTESIRREKSTLLYKINQVLARGKILTTPLSMENTLEDLRNEFERLKTTMENEKAVKFCKQSLLMIIQGVEMMNTRFDPIGVDLDGWSENVGYSMENQDYDDVLSELYEKYKGSGQMSPELKLVFMILGSATMFSMTKKLSKMESDSGNGLGGLMNLLNLAKTPAPAPTPPVAPQQQTPMFRQQPQQHQSPMFKQPQQQQQTQQNQNQEESNIPDLSFLRQNRFPIESVSDSESDHVPAKLQGPLPGESFDSPESINLESVLQTMQKTQQRKAEDKQENLENEEQKLIFEKPTKKRGRPKKGSN